MGVYRVILQLVFFVIVFTSLNGSYGDVKLDKLSILRLLMGQNIEKNQVQGKQRNEQSAKSASESLTECVVRWLIPLGEHCDIAKRDAQKQKVLNLYNKNEDIPPFEWEMVFKLSCYHIHPCRNGLCTCVNPITVPAGRFNPAFMNFCLDTKKAYDSEFKCDDGLLKEGIEDLLSYVGGGSTAHECENNWMIPTKQRCDNKKYIELEYSPKKPMNEYTDEDYKAAYGVICSQGFCEYEVCSCETLPCKDDELVPPNKKCDTSSSSLLNKPLSPTQIFIFNIISWLLLSRQFE